MVQSQPSLRSIKHPRNAQLISLVVMASFGMLFGTFLLSFLLAQSRNAFWPPIGVSPVNITLSWLATGVIAASSILYSYARRAHKAGERRALKWSLLGTLALALFFLILQYITLEPMWTSAQKMSPDIYTGFVLLLIGLHALHLVGGLGGLSYVLARAWMPRATISETSMQIVGWFWHFLGGLWAMIFLVLVI